MYYLIEPMDSFFFRSAVPFEEGGETVAVESMFPPLPSVYAGAFRRLCSLEGRKDAGRIKIGFNGLVLGQESLFPMPADLYWGGGGEGGTLLPFGLAAAPASNYPLDYCFSCLKEADGKDKEHRKPYLSCRSMQSYLNGSGMEYECIDLNKGYLVRAPRIGIQIDPGSGTAKEHLFYQITEVRPAKEKPLKLAVSVEVKEPGQQWGQGGEEACGCGESVVMRLGGEGRLAEGRRIQHLQLPEAGQGQPAAPYFKLYLATPAIFEKGWLDRETYEGIFTHKNRSVRVKLIAAGVGRSIPCGGYGHDEEGYHPRELRYAVPAGSVYYFRLLKGTYEDAVKLFHGKCISDYRENRGFTHPYYNKYRYCDRGYGFALVGRLRKGQEEMIDGQ